MLDSLLTDADPAPYRVVNGSRVSSLLFVCDHASNRIPQSMNDGQWTGLAEKHIGWDIGAADITEWLATRFDAPAVLGNYSRLVADLNRFPDDPTFAPDVSDGHVIPANQTLPAHEHQRRVDFVFAPYHCRVEMHIDRLLNQGVIPKIILIHSMTPQIGSDVRDMQIEVMSAADRRLADPLLDALSSVSDLSVADNIPYRLDETDYTAVTHCIRRGLPHVQIEFRQDLIDTTPNAEQWAETFAAAIEQSGIADAELAGGDIAVLREELAVMRND